MTDKEILQVEIESPFGRQPIESFIHHLKKVASDADERWGIDISVTKVSQETDLPTEFDDG